MSCLDNIVSLGYCSDETPSLSGFTLSQAAGISILNLADTATETYGQGIAMAEAKKTLSILQVKNDFIGALQANKIVTTISEPTYQSSVFNTSVNNGTYAGYRGITVHKSGTYRGGRLRKTFIKSIQLYPLSSGETTINIEDGYNSYSYAVEVVGGQVNTFNEDNLDNFPFVMAENFDTIRITVDNTNIAFASSVITCMKGCNGTVPNPCGWVDGWDGTRAIKAEGYGINVEFYCQCDYEQVLCDLAKSFMGELIWLKWQINIFDEQYKSNRFTDWVVYGHEEIQKVILPDLERQYNNKWNALMNGVFGILQTYKDDCLNCRSIRWRTNV